MGGREFCEGRKMDCREALETITNYLQGQLQLQKEIDLIEHVEHCPACFDELELNYIMLIGLDKLDEEQSVSMDFTAMLQEHLEESKRQYRKKRRILYFLYSGLISSVLVLLGFISYFVFFA